ncbi:MAG: hypothetical protein AVDCRST_MAG35-2531, partial [uncultured Quadrisphaera sp.]
EAAARGRRRVGGGHRHGPPLPGQPRAHDLRPRGPAPGDPGARRGRPAGDPAAGRWCGPDQRGPLDRGADQRPLPLGRRAVRPRAAAGARGPRGPRGPGGPGAGAPAPPGAVHRRARPPRRPPPPPGARARWHHPPL